MTYFPFTNHRSTTIAIIPQIITFGLKFEYVPWAVLKTQVKINYRLIIFGQVHILGTYQKPDEYHIHTHVTQTEAVLAHVVKYST